MNDLRNQFPVLLTMNRDAFYQLGIFIFGPLAEIAIDEFSLLLKIMVSVSG
jgi:hypothetical protein